MTVTPATGMLPSPPKRRQNGLFGEILGNVLNISKLLEPTPQPPSPLNVGASIKAIAAVVYLRVMDTEGNVMLASSWCYIFPAPAGWDMYNLIFY